MPPEPHATDGRRRHRLTRPFWAEPPEERAYRRGRLAITGPCGTLVGLAFGALAATRWGLPPLSISLAGATAGFVLMYVMGQVESLARAVARSRGQAWSLLIRLGTDVAAGGLLGRTAAAVLDADALASLAAGASILAAYSAVATRFFWGGWVEGVVDVLTGQGGTARGPGYSHAASLAARGRVDEALGEYLDACRSRPGDPEPMLLAAAMLRDHRRWDEALDWYRAALDARRTDPARAAAAVRQVWEIHTTRLDDPTGALPDLAAVAARWPDAPETGWARRELEALRRELYLAGRKAAAPGTAQASLTPAPPAPPPAGRPET